MYNNKISNDYFASYLFEFLAKSTNNTTNNKPVDIKRHVEEVQSRTYQEDQCNLPEGVRYFVELMTVSDDVFATEDVKVQEKHFELVGRLMKDISKPENSELKNAINTFTKDLIGQYFQRLEDLRVGRGFDSVASMYDAARNNADARVQIADISNLTQNLISDFTGQQQERGFDSVVSMYDAARNNADARVQIADISSLTRNLISDCTGQQQERGLFQRLRDFFSRIVNACLLRRMENNQQRADIVSSTPIVQQLSQPQNTFERIKENITALQRRIKAEQGENIHIISDTVACKANEALRSSRGLIQDVEHKS